MIPWKVLALIAFTLLAVGALFFYLRGSRDITWGKPGRGEQRLLMSSAILTMAMIVTMGFIRENGRVPDLITGHMTLQHQQEITQPEVGPRVAP